MRHKDRALHKQIIYQMFQLTGTFAKLVGCFCFFAVLIYYPDVGAFLICALIGFAPCFKKSSLIKTILYLCSQ